MSYWVYTNRSDRAVQLRLDNRDREPKLFDIGPKEETAFEASALEAVSIWVTQEDSNQKSHACVTKGVVGGLCEEISEEEPANEGCPDEQNVW